MSLHVAICGPNRLVAASDSRGCSDVTRDDYQKLIQAGERTLIGILGMLTLDPEFLMADQIALMCAADKTLLDSPQSLLTALAEDLQPDFDRLYRDHPVPETPAVFSAFAVRRSRDGTIDLSELYFRVETDESGKRIVASPDVREQLSMVPPGPFIYTIGWAGCLLKCLSTPDRSNEAAVRAAMAREFHTPAMYRFLNSDLPDEVLLGRIDSVFADAKSRDSFCSEKIGGAIDIAAIDSAGFRWLRQKSVRAEAECLTR